MTIVPLPKKPRRSQSRSLLLPKHHEEGAADGASFAGAVFNLSTTIIGVGIMALPAAVKVLGLIPGLVSIVVAALLTRASIDMILRFGRVASKGGAAVTYAGIAGEVFGCTGRALLQTCIIVNNLGVLVVYMIIIGDVLSGTSTASGEDHHAGVVEEWFGPHWWTARAPLLFLTTLFVFAPLISFRRVDSLSYTSALSVTLAVLFVVITAGIVIIKIIDGSIGMPRLFPVVVDQASFWKLFTTVPVLVTAYICHYSIHPIENELKDPAQMQSIVDASLALCSAVYVATSLFGFLLFGDSTADDVLSNFDADLGIPSFYGPALSAAVRVSYAAHLMLVFPIVFYSLRVNLDGLFFPLAVPLALDRRRFAIITATLVAAVFVGATAVPSIWDAFQFTGATAAVTIAFIFPAAMVLRDVHGIATWRDRILAWMMLVMAVTSSSIAVGCDAYDLFRR